MNWLLPTLILLATSGGVTWEHNLETAQRRARRLDKPLMIDFYAPWCGWSRRLEQTTYMDPEVVHLSKHFVALKVNTEGQPRAAALARLYNVGSLPTIAFLSPEGHLLLRVNGYQGPGVFPETMRRARRNAQTVMGFEKTLRRSPEDAAALARLGWHLFEQESFDESRALLLRAVLRDARQPSAERKHSRMLLALIHLDEQRFAQAESLLHEALKLFPREPDDAKLLFLLGRTYAEWGRLDKADLTWRRLVDEFPRSQFAQQANEKLHTPRAR